MDYGVDPSNITGRTDPLGFLIERCSLVTISHCRIYGSNVPITFRDSTVMATDSVFTEAVSRMPSRIFVNVLNEKQRACFSRRRSEYQEHRNRSVDG